METISIKQCNKRYGINATFAILNLLGKPHKSIKKYNGVIVSIPNFNELIETMYHINESITNPIYNSTMKNKFYSYKHKLIKFLIDTEKVKTAIESDDNYKFIINGYEFHQPKLYFKNEINFNVVSTEIYKGKAISDKTFTDEQWKIFVAGVIATRAFNA